MWYGHAGDIRQSTQPQGSAAVAPGFAPAHDDEVLFFIERHALMGRGMGYVDAHLPAAKTLADPARLWTRDKRLKKIAMTLALSHEA